MMQKQSRTSIDRRALVERHHVTFTEPDPAETPQVGNGEIAFGIDVTGLQTFYGNTIAQWGWHSFPLPPGTSESDFQWTPVPIQDRHVLYAVGEEGQEALVGWLRQNPHRLNLGQLALLLDGRPIEPGELSGINQELNLWRGLIISRYRLANTPVEVLTTCHPSRDAIAVRVDSPLIAAQRLSVQFAFAYGNPNDRTGADWTQPQRHATRVTSVEDGALFQRMLDADRYESRLDWEGPASLERTGDHAFVLTAGRDRLSFVCQFAGSCQRASRLEFEPTRAEVEASWRAFWSAGGAVDLSESHDPRAEELERRVVLSQYLTAVNSAGSLPPQESGLLNNSGWHGKFHLEMHWWHATHFQPWDRWPLIERSLGYYRRILPQARWIARKQGYEGCRWPKMVGPAGRFSPHDIGPRLIWQQPHPIFYAELHYRDDPSEQTLKAWRDLVYETASFMASFAHYNEATGHYDLGPWIVNAAENNLHVKPETINPAFELAYWHHGLKTAIRWLERLSEEPPPHWRSVADGLAPLPTEQGVYVMYEGVPDMWNSFNVSHIDVIGPAAFLPGETVDMETFRRTIRKAVDAWRIDTTWGWDFPWLAMAAARAGMPDVAVEALLMPSVKNEYSRCGWCKGGPAASYLPGNGGLLYAVAMMAAGWDGAPTEATPGFPDNGAWTVRHEGLRPTP